MDTKDDFEFKPLSKGLGFHPRDKKLQSSQGKQLSNSLSGPMASMDFESENSNEKLSAQSVQTLTDSEVSKKKTSPDFAPPNSKIKFTTETTPASQKTKDKGSVYTIDESLSLDHMPQFKTPITSDSPFFEKTRTPLNEKIQPTKMSDTANEIIRESKKSPHQISPTSQTAKQAVDDILKTLKEKKGSDQKTSQPAAKSLSQQVKKTTSSSVNNPTLDPMKQKLMQEYRPTLMSWGAAFLDGLLVFAASLLCMIILLTVTRVDLLKTLSQSTDREIYIALFGLFALVNFIYMTVHRVFLGQTPGEWAFDQRLGDLQEQFELSYIFKVSARSLILIATGILPLPLLSTLIGRDLLADVLGLQLYEKKN